MPNWGAVFGWYTYNKTNATKVIRIVGLTCQCALLVMCLRAVPIFSKSVDVAVWWLRLRLFIVFVVGMV